MKYRILYSKNNSQCRLCKQKDGGWVTQNNYSDIVGLIKGLNKLNINIEDTIQEYEDEINDLDKIDNIITIIDIVKENIKECEKFDDVNSLKLFMNKELSSVTNKKKLKTFLIGMNKKRTVLEVMLYLYNCILGNEGLSAYPTRYSTKGWGKNGIINPYGNNTI